jgi:hypothetical protein
MASVAAFANILEGRIDKLWLGALSRRGVHPDCGTASLPVTDHPSGVGGGVRILSYSIPIAIRLP